MKTLTEPKPNELELRELDAWIWENVYGAHLEYSELCPKTFVCCVLPKANAVVARLSGKIVSHGSNMVSVGSFETARNYTAGRYAPCFTTDEKCAMKVLEKCAEKIEMLPPIQKRESGWWFIFNHQHFNAETLPLAICKFAEQLFGK